MNLKRIFAVLLVAVFIVLPTKSWAGSDTDERIEKLEQEVEDLKAGQEKEGPTVKASFPVKFYGFVAVQPTWASAKTTLYGSRNSAAAMSSVQDKTVNPANGNAWFSITPQNSRLGLNWTGTKVGESTYIGGIFEIDFVNIINNTSYGTSPIPRIRHLSFELWGKRWSFLAGQNWDIFSPLNTKSLSLGNNLWFQGNMGFRRPQLRFTYDIPFADVNNFKISVSADHPSNTDDLYNGGVDSSYPYGEWLLQYSRKMQYGDLIVATSGAAGNNRANNRHGVMWGVAGSLNVPFHKFLKLTGELHWGQDMGNFLSFVGATTRARDIAAWGEISNRWHKKFETNFGYGIDNIQTSKLAAGAVQRNQIIYGNFKYWPVEPFYIGIEYEYMRTHYRMSTPSSAASAVFANLVYTF